MIIIGLDPGLTCTGWGIVAKSGSRLSHVANGQIRTDAKAGLAERLVPAGAAADADAVPEAPIGAAPTEGDQVSLF